MCDTTTKSLVARRLALVSGLVLLKLPHECGSMMKITPVNNKGDNVDIDWDEEFKAMSTAMIILTVCVFLWALYNIVVG